MCVVVVCDLLDELGEFVWVEIGCVGELVVVDDDCGSFVY